MASDEILRSGDQDETEVPGLNKRQAAFVREYLLDLNATQAYIRAGYSPATAGVAAHQLLNNPKVTPHVARALAQRAARVGAKADDVLSEMNVLAFSSVDHYVVDDDGEIKLAEGAPYGALGAIQSVKRRKTVREDKDGTVSVTYDVELRLWNKPEPLKLMGKHVGLKFNDRVEVSGPDGGPIVTKILREVIDGDDEGGGS